VASALPVGSAAAAGESRTFGFDADLLAHAPTGFALGTTGRGAAGRWVVRRETDSPSPPNLLAQIGADPTGSRFPVAVATRPRLADVRVSVRCKMVSGQVDRACGLVARYANDNNYLVTRANALENNVRLYTVKAGKRDELASFKTRVTAAVWHHYRFELRGDQLRVFWDGELVLDHVDSTFTRAGLAGVWTKADSVTYFDDLVIEPL
jgi:hypothetical protein